MMSDGVWQIAGCLEAGVVIVVVVVGSWQLVVCSSSTGGSSWQLVVVWQIAGCVEALEDRSSNVCSVYSSKYVENVWPTVQRLSAGNAVFTFPLTPVKCAGAAQKICFLAEEHVTQASPLLRFVLDQCVQSCYFSASLYYFFLRTYNCSLIICVMLSDVKLQYLT